MIRCNNSMVPTNLILDVDGVFTDGKMYYSSEGKVFKVFGSDDHDALNIIRNKLNISVVSADFRGFEISKQRIENDMGLDLQLVGSRERAGWLMDRFDPKFCVYMGDGLLDPLVFQVVSYSIAPANASVRTQKAASYVTKSKGSEGAVSEAVIHLMDLFFGGFERNLE